MTTIERARPPVRAATRPVLAIIGPSGGGKSTVVRALSNSGVLTVHPTWTTRPRRADEEDGSVEHRFVSEEEFDALCRRRFFLDTVTLFGLPYRYGLPPLLPSAAGPLDTVMLRAPLVSRFAAFYPHHLVYQIEDAPERVEARLRQRGSSPDDVAARLVDNRHEIEAGRTVASRVFLNRTSLDDLTGAVASALEEDLA